MQMPLNPTLNLPIETCEFLGLQGLLYFLTSIFMITADHAS